MTNLKSTQSFKSIKVDVNKVIKKNQFKSFPVKVKSGLNKPSQVMTNDLNANSYLTM